MSPSTNGEKHGNLTEGYLRLPHVLKIIPVSQSTWYRGIRSGRYPQPVKLYILAAGVELFNSKAGAAGTSGE
ncbi:MAG: AlpA family phage regulatory protein [Armatimonadetes bacterium]|nr:AlpA family phage regulatory protein [Akkermansiaceae bacterium]